MTLDILVKNIGARVLTPKELSNIQINRVYAGDKMSELLNEASDDTLLVTNLNSEQLIRIAQLMDVPAICLVRGITPHLEVIDKLSRCSTVLLSSPMGMFETCGKLYCCFLNET